MQHFRHQVREFAIKSAILAKRSRQIPYFASMPPAPTAQREQPVSPGAARQEAEEASRFYIMPDVISEYDEMRDEMRVVEITIKTGRQP
ncbi:hypothetical protein [Pseudoduganella umbonata]|uniref:Uncharacterized protein n=1 Tax=Pseudoduganella umbonata TaxID=864828 RepID=A0A4P8HU11_9BURK|nr:hypothetical protein [Pseudoduganella umbonata]MBB3220444.1 hypothetical protein [Pseudoduganella umbonata]QCP12030.1 hypothetical protein FCL38_17620 [Pseudoduganella umbonata]